jgi:hypothetical protein
MHCMREWRTGTINIIRTGGKSGRRSSFLCQAVSASSSVSWPRYLAREPLRCLPEIGGHAQPGPSTRRTAEPPQSRLVRGPIPGPHFLQHPIRQRPDLRKGISPRAVQARAFQRAGQLPQTFIFGNRFATAQIARSSGLLLGFPFLTFAYQDPHLGVGRRHMTSVLESVYNVFDRSPAGKSNCRKTDHYYNQDKGNT